MEVAVQGGWSRCRRSGVAFALFVLCPASASALTGVSIKDIDDPVAPGGVLSYLMALSDLTPPAPPTPPCFNPPPDCVVTPVTCSHPAPTCEGSTFVGFTCHNSANDGVACGSTTPDVSLCTARATGTCTGGNNKDLACTADDGALTQECPGSTLVCARSGNDGDYCGEGYPAQPQPSFCFDGPGVCSGGPNNGQPCTAPHLQPSPTECPPDTVPPAPTPIVLTLPIPTGTTFLSADNGGTSDGTTITWNIAPLNTCGHLGQAACPMPLARLAVDPLMPIGSIVRNHARATDGDGFIESAEERTIIGTFGPSRIGVQYPPRPGRDHFRYRTIFALNPGATIDPATEGVDFQVTDSLGILVHFNLPPGSLVFRGDYHAVAIWSYRSTMPGLRRLAIALRGTANYSFQLDARFLDLPDVAGTTLTVTITIGDDTLVQYLTVHPNRTGRRFSGHYP